jgi:hypothetical protein
VDDTDPDRIAALEAEIERLHRFCMALAERIAAASEVLGKVAEKKEKRKCNI